MWFASWPITCRLAANHLCHSALISVVVAVGPRWRAAIDHRVSPRCTTMWAGPPALLAGSPCPSGDHEGVGAASSPPPERMVCVTRRNEASGVASATFARAPTAYWVDVTTAGRGVWCALPATAVAG